MQKRLGPAHTGKGRCPESWHTRKTAEAELRRILTDAEFVAYDRAEIDRLVLAAGDDGPLFLVAALTGLRQGEMRFAGGLWIS